MVMGDRIPAGDAAVDAEVQADTAQQIADMAVTRGVERLGGTGRIISEWMPIFMNLTELDEAGALGGIRAIVTERLAMVRGQSKAAFPPAEAGRITVVAEITESTPVSLLAEAAALLATGIDRLETGR